MKTVKELLVLSRKAMSPYANEISHQYIIEAIKIADLTNPYDMSELWICLDMAGADLFDYRDRAKKANYYLTVLANLGNLFAIETLMIHYLEGINGVEKNDEQFKYWANKAVEYGSESAKNELRRFERKNRQQA
jgi:TPR repeat protein